MAGTSRQSRARDTTNTHRRQRSTSQVASIVPETAVVTNTKVVEIAKSADADSPQPKRLPQPETPANRSVTAFCKKCNSKVGDFYNSWHKVTSSYYSPALLGSYRSLLQSSNQRKEASDSTELAGCIIDLTCCPSCNNYLGFVVVDTTASGKRFRGRDFFKLQHIELRSEISPKKTITVEPQENVAPDLTASKVSKSPSPARVETVTDTMEVDTPLSSSHPLWSQHAHSEPQQQRQQSQPREPLRQLLQSNTPQPPVVMSRSPVNQSVASIGTAPTTAPSQMSPRPAQPHSGNIVGSSIRKAQPEPIVNGHKDGPKYPQDPREVYFDAIERLQTQTSQNTSVLAAQARTQMESADIVRQIESSLRHEFQSQLQRQDQELRRMSEAVNQLARELAECRQNMVGLGQEVHVARTENARRPSEAVQLGYQDDALELMAQRIGEVSHRTTDLETLRDHVAILGGKVHRLESESAAACQPHPHAAYPAHQPVHPATSHPTQAPPFQTPVRPTSISHAVPSQGEPTAVKPLETTQRHETAPSQNGWATVNAGVKRVFENGTDSPHQGASPEPGSPKRPKLVTAQSWDGPTVAQHSLEPLNALSSQIQPGPHPDPHLEPHTGPHPVLPSTQPYSPYSTQDGPSDQSWRSESQRMAESRPARGRGSRGGRGPGSRGGRVRKSMQGQHHHIATPEWERDHWTAVPDSQASPNSFEGHYAHPTRSVVRRGGGGSGFHVRPSSLERSNEWTPEIGPRSVYHKQDSPIEVKKTRSKPVRNEDGILVRKDGRPDRRSQSSAANLRKVHARKEEQQREAEAASTPNGSHLTMSVGAETPSPRSRDRSEQDVTDSVRKKHHDILGRIFPDGIDTSRRQHDYAYQVFNEDHDHTAHPRAKVAKIANAPRQVKKEHVEHSEIAETQDPTDVDVEMSEAGASTYGHAHNDTQTPAGEAVDVSEQGAVQDRANAVQGSRIQDSEAQATDGSATLATESVETA